LSTTLLAAQSPLLLGFGFGFGAFCVGLFLVALVVVVAFFGADLSCVARGAQRARSLNVCSPSAPVRFTAPQKKNIKQQNK